MLHQVIVFCQPLRPVFLLVAFAWRPPSWSAGVVLIAVGVVSWPLLPTPLRILVVHHLPRCVSVGMWFVGLLFLPRSLDSHPFFPSRVVSGCCVLVATAACVPAGVISASAEPRNWYTRVVLVGAGVVSRFLLPTPPRTQVVHPMPRHISMCMRPNTSTPPSGVLVVHHVPPCHVGPRGAQAPHHSVGRVCAWCAP